MTQKELSKPRPFRPIELAKRWGCSKGLIYKMLNDGRLTGFRVGDLYRITFDEVERYEKGQSDAAIAHASVTEVPRSANPPRKKPQCLARGPQRAFDRLGGGRSFT